MIEPVLLPPAARPDERLATPAIPPAPRPSGSARMRPAPRADADADARELAARLRRENELLMTKLARMGHAVRGLAADLAAARRECRGAAQQIESLKAENTRLAAARNATDVDAPEDDAGDAAAEVLRLAVRCRTHERALARMASALLVLRGENAALGEANARLRLELMRCRA